MERSLIYVSRRTMVTLDPGKTLADIVAVAHVRNKALGLTGSLACTRDHFAQLVEGPGGAIDAIMHDIEQDDRHTEITILRESAITRRQLPEWSMAYSGASTYVARQIEALLDEVPDNIYRIDRILSLLIGFATANDPVTRDHVRQRPPRSPVLRIDEVLEAGQVELAATGDIGSEATVLVNDGSLAGAWKR